MTPDRADELQAIHDLVAKGINPYAEVLVDGMPCSRLQIELSRRRATRTVQTANAAMQSAREAKYETFIRKRINHGLITAWGHAATSGMEAERYWSLVEECTKALKERT